MALSLLRLYLLLLPSRITVSLDAKATGLTKEENASLMNVITLR